MKAALDFTAFGINSQDLAKYVLLDTETTGLQYDDEIIEIAIVDMSGNVVYNSRFFPEKEVNPDAAKVNHMTKDILKGCPLFKDEWDNIYKLLGGRRVVAHNGSFDKRSLKQTLDRYQLTDVSEDVFRNSIDTLQIFKQIPGRKKNSLDYIAHEFGVLSSDQSEAHTAVDDCRLLGNVMYKTNDYIAKNMPKSKLPQIEIPSAPTRILVFGYIMDGVLNMEEIAEKIGRSLGTVEGYVCEACEKMPLLYERYLDRDIEESVHNLNFDWNNVKLSDIKERFPNISWLQIRLAVQKAKSKIDIH